MIDPVSGSSAATMVFEVTEDGYGECVGFSDGAVELTGYSAGEMLGTRALEVLVPAADLPFEESRARRAYRSGFASASRMGEYQRKTLVAKNGEKIPCAVCGELASCLTDDGNRLGYALVSTWARL